MKRKVEYHPEARAEIHNTANWYDKRTEGLGLEFLLEVRFAESQIIQHSDMWPIYEGDTRRYLLKKFPFSIIYLITDNKIQIVAVAHYRKNPDTGKKVKKIMTDKIGTLN